MGTNYYIQRKRPVEVRPAFHICKRSAGWNIHFQDSSGQTFTESAADVPFECPAFHSAADIRNLLESGEWFLADEYGRTWDGDDALREFGELCAWRGGERCKDPQDSYMGDDYRDPQGFLFTPSWFC